MFFGEYKKTIVIFAISEVEIYASKEQPDAQTGIYVPDELVDAYKSAENWSAYGDIIKPLSDYQNT